MGYFDVLSVVLNQSGNTCLQSLPVIIFINAVIAAGYHVGAVQAIVASFGGFLAFCLETTNIESVNAAANVFLGLVNVCGFVKIAVKKSAHADFSGLKRH